MKKILTLLALVSSSICFASGDGNLPVKKKAKSVASALVTSIADLGAFSGPDGDWTSASVAPTTDLGAFSGPDGDWASASVAQTTETVKFFRKGGELRSDVRWGKLHIHLKYLKVEMGPDRIPCKITWQNSRGKTDSSSDFQCYFGARIEYKHSSGLPVIMVNEYAIHLYLDGRTSTRKMNRKIDELFINCESTPAQSVGKSRCVCIHTDNEPDRKLSVGRLIMNNIDDLYINNYIDGKLCIGCIEMRGSRYAFLNLDCNVDPEDDRYYECDSDGNIKYKKIHRVSTITYGKTVLSGGEYKVAPNGNLIKCP